MWGIGIQDGQITTMWMKNHSSQTKCLIRCVSDVSLVGWFNVKLYALEAAALLAPAVSRLFSKARIFFRCMIVSVLHSFLFKLLKDFIYLFLEKGKGRERRETSIWEKHLLPLLCAPIRVPGPEPRHVPWLEIELWPFTLRDNTQQTEPHRSGPFCIAFDHVS